MRIGEGAARPGLLPGAEPGDQGDQLFDAGEPVRSGSLSEAGQAADVYKRQALKSRNLCGLR